jgi:hypothetical protein
MDINKYLSTITKLVSERKEASETLNFYVNLIQPIKKYFEDDNQFKNLDIADVSSKPTIKERDKEIKYYLDNYFEEDEPKEYKKEFSTGFKYCWSWLKGKKII